MKDDASIPGLKLIFATGRQAECIDDPSLPYKFEIELSPPEFMQVAFIMLYGGTERVIVRGETREAIDTFIARNEFAKHPRLRRYTITNPDGSTEVVERENSKHRASTHLGA